MQNTNDILTPSRKKCRVRDKSWGLCIDAGDACVCVCVAVESRTLEWDSERVLEAHSKDGFSGSLAPRLGCVRFVKFFVEPIIIDRVMEPAIQSSRERRSASATGKSVDAEKLMLTQTAPCLCVCVSEPNDGAPYV